MRTESNDKLTRNNQPSSAKIIEKSKNIYSNSNFQKRPNLDKSSQPKSFEGSQLLSDHSNLTGQKTFSSTNIDNVPLIYTKLIEKIPENFERQNSPSITSRLFNLLKPKQTGKVEGDSNARNVTPNFQNGLFKHQNSSVSKDGQSKSINIPQIYQQTKTSNSQLNSPFRIPVPLQLGSCSPVKMSKKTLDGVNLNNHSKTSIKSVTEGGQNHLYSIPSSGDDRSLDPLASYKPFSMNPSPKSKKGNTMTFQFKKGELSAQYRSKIQDHESSKLSLSDKPNKESRLKSSFLKGKTVIPAEQLSKDLSQKDDLLFKSIQLDKQPNNPTQVFNSNGRKDTIGKITDKNKPNLIRQLSNPTDIYNNSLTHNSQSRGSKHQGQIEAIQCLNKKIMDKAKRLQQVKNAYF